MIHSQIKSHAFDNYENLFFEINKKGNDINEHGAHFSYKQLVLKLKAIIEDKSKSKIKNKIVEKTITLKPIGHYLTTMSIKAKQNTVITKERKCTSPKETRRNNFTYSRNKVIDTKFLNGKTANNNLYFSNSNVNLIRFSPSINKKDDIIKIISNKHKRNNSNHINAQISYQNRNNRSQSNKVISPPMKNTKLLYHKKILTTYFNNKIARVRSTNSPQCNNNAKVNINNSLKTKKELLLFSSLIQMNKAHHRNLTLSNSINTIYHTTTKYSIPA